ncbi:MAG: hypothetical protein ACOH2J_13055 [Allorhizobium sp.]
MSKPKTDIKRAAENIPPPVSILVPERCNRRRYQMPQPKSQTKCGVRKNKSLSNCRNNGRPAPVAPTTIARSSALIDEKPGTNAKCSTFLLKLQAF